MKKNAFAQMIALVVLAVFISAAAMSTRSTAMTQDQKNEEVRKTMSSQWEYAVISNITELGRGHNSSDMKFMGIAELCYVRESGCQALNIEGSDRVTALAKTMARLGNEGWEMVGESPFPFNNGNQGALFFKRPKK